MHLPVNEFLTRWSNKEIREMIALESLKERTELEAEDSRAGLHARARKHNREVKAEEEKDELDGWNIS